MGCCRRTGLQVPGSGSRRVRSECSLGNGKLSLAIIGPRERQAVLRVSGLGPPPSSLGHNPVFITPSTDHFL